MRGRSGKILPRFAGPSVFRAAAEADIANVITIIMYLLSYELWSALLPLFLFPAIFSGIAVILFARSARGVVFLLCFSLALIGMVAGYAMGNSRAPAVGNVVPALLTFIGGFFALFVSKLERNSILLGSIAIICLTANLLVGTFSGSYSREQYERYGQSMGYRLDELVKEEAVRQLFDELRRESLGDLRSQ